MPRLDNSDGAVIATYELKFNDDDPGATPPVDLCIGCWYPWLNTGLEIDHPNYDDDKYYCHECGVLLVVDDNSY